MVTSNDTISQTRAKGLIELSSLVWFKRRLPASVQLEQSSLRIPGIPKGMHGLFGHHGRHQGFMSARAHVESTGQNYTVIDYRVKVVPVPSQTKVTASDVAERETLPIHLLARDFAVDLNNRVREQLRLHAIPEANQTANALLLTVQQAPKALTVLMAFEELEHIKLFIYSAKPDFCDTPLAVGTVPERYLPSIVSASCRLDPDLSVLVPTIGAPSSSDTNAPDHRPATSPKSPRA